MGRYVNPLPDYTRSNVALAGGQLFFYITGTSTLKDTYADSALTVPNANPVILDAEGRVPDIFLAEDQAYKVILKTAPTTGNPDGIQVFEVDPVGPETNTEQWEEWSAAETYAAGRFVGRSGSYYFSIQASTNKDPATQPAYWSVVRVIPVWNTNQTFAAGEPTFGSDGELYISRTSSNTGNDPTTDTVNWEPAVKTADADGAFESATTVSGHGITSVTRSSAGRHVVTCAKAASATANQTAQGTCGGTNATVGFWPDIQRSSTTTLTVRTRQATQTGPSVTGEQDIYPTYIQRRAY